MVNEKFIFKNLFFILSILILFQSFFLILCAVLPEDGKSAILALPNLQQKPIMALFGRSWEGVVGWQKYFAIEIGSGSQPAKKKYAAEQRRHSFVNKIILLNCLHYYFSWIVYCFLILIYYFVIKGQKECKSYVGAPHTWCP